MGYIFNHSFDMLLVFNQWVFGMGLSLSSSIVYCRTELYLDAHPDLEPLPGLGQQEGTNSSLASVQGQFLVLKFLELHP